MENNNSLSKAGKITLFGIDHTAMHDCGEEFSLQDYYPEVRRIISVRCKAIPETKFVGSGTVEFDGTAAFTVMYIGENGDMTSVSLSCPYTSSYSMSVPDDSEQGEIHLDTSVESVNCRVLGPRRLSLKARLKTQISCDSSIIHSCDVKETLGNPANGADRISLEEKMCDCISGSEFRGSFTSSMMGDMDESGNAAPVWCDGDIVVNEAKSVQGGVIIRGDVVISAILFGEDGRYFMVRRRYPFEEQVEIPSAVEGLPARGWGIVTSASVTSPEEGGRMKYEVEYDLFGEVCERNTSTYPEDAYSTKWESTLHTGQRTTVVPVKCGVGNVSIGGSFDRKGKKNDSEYVIGTVFNPKWDRLSRDGGKLILTGTTEAGLLIAGGGEVTEEIYEIPMKYETDSQYISEENGDIICHADISVSDGNGRIDGDRVNINCNLTISMSAAEKQTISMIDEVILDKTSPADKREGVITVYYPEDGESMWDIGKKYGVSVASINKADNGRSDSPVII